MPSGNLDESVTAAVPDGIPPRSFRLPADYYTSPLSEVRPLFPYWVPMGCGIASAVILVLLFAAGAVINGPRLAQFMDYVLGTSLGELKGMYAADINATQKAQFDTEVNRLREGLRKDKVSIKNLQPFLKAMESAISDKKVTAGELETLTKSAHEAVARGKAVPPPVEEPAPPREHHPLAD